MPAVLKGKISRRDSDGHELLQPHRFDQQRLRVPLCDHCGSTIWGIATGWTCVDCGVTCHERCRNHVPPNCGSASGAALFDGGVFAGHGDGAEADGLHSRGALTPVAEVEEAQRAGHVVSAGSAPAATQPTPPTRRETAGSIHVGRSTFLHGTAPLPQGPPEGVSVYHGTTGLLYKMGGRVRNWKLRWCFLDAELRQLRYYRPPTNTELKGVIHLDTVTAVRPSQVCGKGTGFYIQLLSPKRVWVLRATSVDQRDVWCAALAAIVGAPAAEGARSSLA